ncbi:hypothetical protein FEZ08_10055 [Culicoidibacter larvae]|uniref:Uncharacterized protein n=1 Tax=Culicoidibacter larvae TaxID=2579976 RepID=A0A5R8Q8Y4_9FIRM|nr:hypothetical protein FEZ08_10055 [Culicoidibacter larvae]
MLYLLGDVLRLYSGDFNPSSGTIGGQKITQLMWFGIALMMSLPIIMMIVNIFVPVPYILWINIVVSVVLFLFNLIGLPSYKSLYDIFLIILGLIANIIIIIIAIKDLLY